MRGKWSGRLSDDFKYILRIFPMQTWLKVYCPRNIGTAVEEQEISWANGGVRVDGQCKAPRKAAGRPHERKMDCWNVAWKTLVDG